MGVASSILESFIANATYFFPESKLVSKDAIGGSPVNGNGIREALGGWGDGWWGRRIYFTLAVTSHHLEFKVHKVFIIG